MQNVKSCVNRFGLRLTVGRSVRLPQDLVNRGAPSIVTIKAFDFSSDYAKAYGAQVSFIDCPYTITIDDCSAI